MRCMGAPIPRGYFPAVENRSEHACVVVVHPVHPVPPGRAAEVLDRDWAGREARYLEYPTGKQCKPAVAGDVEAFDRSLGRKVGSSVRLAGVLFALGVDGEDG